MEKYKKSVVLAAQMVKYLKGMLSEEEENALKKELHDHPEKEKILERAREGDVIAGKHAVYDSFDMERSWCEVNRVIGKKSSGSFYRILRYAAILVLPLAVSVWLFLDTREEKRPQYIVDAYFESHKTVLELPGGQQIALDTVENVMKELNEYGVVVGDGEQGLDYSGNDSVADSKVGYHRIIVPRGGEYNLKLADGTNVWMFAESEIRFPTHFEKNKREVYLSGEAYFEVHHDPRSPFYVKTKSLDVKVLGTTFNVKAYDDVDVVETSLVEGVVSVKGNVLRPDMQAVFHKSSGDFSYRKIDGDSYRLRKERMFVFDEERLDNILREMARWYDFEIFYQNQEVSDKRFGFKLEKYEHVDSLLNILELTGEVRFSMRGRTLIVMSGV